MGLFSSLAGSLVSSALSGGGKKSKSASQQIKPIFYSN